MAAAEQLDLFSVNPDPAEPKHPRNASRRVIAGHTLDDDSLVAALCASGIRDSAALAAEAGRRRAAAAIPTLEGLCWRLAGFGRDRIVPEQAAALEALAVIGGPDAARAIVRLIDTRVVEGPCLKQAVAAAVGLAAAFPRKTVLELLRHGEPRIRADACRCARLWPEALPLLRELLDDLDPTVRRAAACALGRLGRNEARLLLTRYLREEPSAEIIDAVVPIADEECTILLGRIARAMPDLSEAALDALDAIDDPCAKKISAAISGNRAT
jgi:hypothetical protein